MKQVTASNDEIAWHLRETGEGERLMGNSQGRDNVKKRAARRKKNDRLAAAKTAAAEPKTTTKATKKAKAKE